LIYTTNAIEALNSKIRRAVRICPATTTMAGRVASSRNVPERSVVASPKMLPTGPWARLPFLADGVPCSRSVGEAEWHPVRRHLFWSLYLQYHC
jgi:hypothetical protein